MRYAKVRFPSNLQDEGQDMRTLPKQDASRGHETETLQRKPDDGVQAAPGDKISSHPKPRPKPREEEDDFTVLLHLGLV